MREASRGCSVPIHSLHLPLPQPQTGCQGTPQSSLRTLREDGKLGARKAIHQRRGLLLSALRSVLEISIGPSTSQSKSPALLGIRSTVRRLRHYAVSLPSSSYIPRKSASASIG